MEGWKRGGALLGRFMLSLIFLIAGSEKFANMVRTQHYMAAMGMPHSIVPPLAYIAAIIEVGCGLAVLLGFQARVAAIILFLFLIPVTIIFHLVPHEMVQVWKMEERRDDGRSSDGRGSRSGRPESGPAPSLAGEGRLRN